MATVSGLLSKFPVLSHDNGISLLSFRYRLSSEFNNGDLSTCNIVPKRISRPKNQSSRMLRAQPLLALSRGGDYGIKYDDEVDEEPFWIHFSKEFIRNMKTLFAFLAQQPGQLKYIEWPSFQDTLRTATLTLILVAMLIVALSSIDSALSYVLALLLRKPA